MIVLVLITVGAVTAMVLGVAPTGGAASGAGGPLFTFPPLNEDDGPDRVPLSVQPNRSEVAVGETVSLTVLGPDGDPVPNATVAVAGSEYETGADGTVVHRFVHGGDWTAEARKVGTEDVIYRPARTTVAVERRTVRLSVSTNRSTATVGDPVGVRVTAPNGSPVAATVTAGPASADTGSDGRAVLRVDASGNYSVTARRAKTDEVHYVAESATLRVEPERVGLSVTVDERSVVAGERVDLTVTRVDTGERVPATLVVDGRRRETGPDGRLAVSFDAAGVETVTATAASTASARFEPVDRVVVVERRTAKLALSVSESRPGRGERVTFRLTRADTGTPVAGGVRVGGHVYRTGDDGVVRLGFQVPGEVLVTGVKARNESVRYAPAHHRLVVTGSYFDVVGLRVPDAEPGENVTVRWTVANRGNERGSRTIAVRVAGRTVATREVTLAAGAATSVSVPVSVPDEAGSYRIAVAAGRDGAATAVLDAVASRERRSAPRVRSRTGQAGE